MHVFNVFFIKLKKHVFMFFICKSMFLTSMTSTHMAHAHTCMTRTNC